uniref:Trm112 family protein n=1 Tax=Anaplasma bovis TaxID=186733 RepID=UPI0039773CCE
MDEKILSVLVCPITGGELVYDAENSELVSKDAGLAFPVREGIPIMLPHEARELS